MIIYSSAKYANTKPNFVLQNMRDCGTASFEKKELYGLICVVQNIIQRGAVTKPSDYLELELGRKKDEKEPFFQLSHKLAKWTQTIKGDQEGRDYPAETFFEKVLPKHLRGQAYLRNLILPEAKMSTILSKKCDEDPFWGQQVDFYFPQIKTVIEIDGSSHDQLNQIRKDAARDDALSKEGINTIRIRAADIKGETAKFHQQLDDLLGRINTSPIVAKYRRDHQAKMDKSMIQYNTVMRCQVLLLSCMKNVMLDTGKKMWNIHVVHADVDDFEKLFQIARTDLDLWFSNIAQLLEWDFHLPPISFVSSRAEADIVIDFSLFERYTDEHISDEDCIFIRNDYYDDKNYFRVAHAESLTYKFRMDGEDGNQKQMQFLLKNIFGHDAYRSGQLNIITNILEQRDTIGILPTGSGKSLCYQLSALLEPGITLVVVPIISLMQDQKKGLSNIGIDQTKYISSALDGQKKETALNNFQNGCYQLIWISPERFQSESFHSTLHTINRNLHFSFATIDEVHCLSEWGHDFRVSYLALIRIIKNYCPAVRLLGLTATASQAVLEDLKREFEVGGEAVKALASMGRDELVFKRITVPTTDGKSEEVLQIVDELSREYGEDVCQLKGSKTRCGLIFTPTVGGRVGCSTVVGKLKMREKIGGEIGIYNGKMSQGSRTTAQKAFMDNEYPIMACTKAFGMGIDKPNIKYTIHYTLPQSIESFYQEAGRAGRDSDKSEKSYCFILNTPEGVSKDIIEQIFSPETDAENRKKLCEENLHNDLSTIMFLWNSNKNTVDQEYEEIKSVLRELFRNREECSLPFHSDSELQMIQNALYKLSLLDIVKEWTIEYHSLGSGSVNTSTHEDFFNKDSIRNALLSYIHKYDVTFDLNGYRKDEKKYGPYRKIMESGDKENAKLIKVLLQWSNMNILNQRLKSTANMLEWCDPSVSDENFRKMIDNYFRYTEETIWFEELIYDPLNSEKWIRPLYEQEENGVEESPITMEKAKGLHISLQRYLESYRYNTGLNFLDGMLRLYTNSSTVTEDFWRLKEAIKALAKGDVCNGEELPLFLQRILTFAKQFTADNKDRFSEVFLAEFPEKAHMGFTILQDHVSLTRIVEKNTRQLNRIMEEKIDGLY